MPKRNSSSAASTSSKNRTKISKYFTSDTHYPTSKLLKKSNFLPAKKFQKFEESETNKDLLEGSQISEPPLEFFNKSVNNAQNSEFVHQECSAETSLPSMKNPKYTPLEKQYLNFKDQHPDAILMIECGYKYRFFGKDAEIASEVLNIACFMIHNFMSSIIPATRLHFHVRRLVERGFKVAVFKQTEFAALKAVGNTKNHLFSRKLDALYTKSTLIGEEFLTSVIGDDLSPETTSDDIGSGYLVCIHENTFQVNKSCPIAVAGVLLSTGDITYSTFEDVPLRNELETCLMHLDPAEILVSTSLSKESLKLINSLQLEKSIRVEKLPDHVFEHSFALKYVSDFYASTGLSDSSSNPNAFTQLVLSLPSMVLSCISALLMYLFSFHLENIFKNVENIKPLSSFHHMVLNTATLNGLEILNNNLNQPSLYVHLNRTFTKFGERLLRSWITRPLRILEEINERLDIVTDIVYSDSIVYKVVGKLLYQLPDLERILCSVFFQKCNCCDFLKLIQSFFSIFTQLTEIQDAIESIRVARISIILTDLTSILQDVDSYLHDINPDAAREGDKSRLFLNTSRYPALQKCQEEINLLTEKLNNLRPIICQTLGLNNFKYATVAGQKYLIEVLNTHTHLVPQDWLKISSTKQLSRYRSPEIIQLHNLLEQQKVLMARHANESWLVFLNNFSKNFCKYKRAVCYLAELDCYLSLSKIAKEENFQRPMFVDSDEQTFLIEQGRHPVLQKIIGDKKQFIGNDVYLDAVKRCTIVTGPNMGGKSTYVRQNALIVILAQSGSYVPAEKAILPLFDNVYVRMGAEDDLHRGKSTFMVEMSETSNMLKNVSPRSFVILDELGRGTSTNDGTAIAHATLEHLISQVKCFTMFVTHYPEIVELEKLYPDNITTVHMGYLLKEGADNSSNFETVTFLYHITQGVSKKSYGINVASLAGISNDILIEAQKKSYEAEWKADIIRRIHVLIERLKNLPT